MVTFAQIFYVQAIWTDEHGDFSHDRLLSEGSSTTIFEIVQDYFIHAYLFLYGDFKEAQYHAKSEEVLRVQWVAFTIIFGIYLMNFLVAFMCDELVKLTDMKQSQENKVMLQLSTEVIKTKIFF